MDGAMADPLRHRQTKGAETAMVSLQPPRHIPTLPDSAIRRCRLKCQLLPEADMKASNAATHSITSSASASSLSGTVRPSALAVF
jgi:hypothetical protein